MKPMDENENRKSHEALPDDALDQVAGGGFKDWLQGLFDKDGNESFDSPPTGQGDHL